MQPTPNASWAQRDVSAGSGAEVRTVDIEAIAYSTICVL